MGLAHHAHGPVVPNTASAVATTGCQPSQGVPNSTVVAARVAEVGRLSANAKNAFNSFVGRVFAKSLIKHVNR